MRTFRIIYSNQWIIVALCIPLIVKYNIDVLDIAIHDVYVVADGNHIAMMLFIFFLFVWLLYRFLPASKTIKWLTHVHLIGFSLCVFLTTLYAFQAMDVRPRRYYDYSVYNELADQSNASLFDMLSLNGLILITFFFPFAVFAIQWIAALVKFIRHKKSGL